MNERILIIEENPALSKGLRRNLEFEGFDVASVAGGASALTEVKRWSPDLVVLDTVLPDVDGLKLCGVLHDGGRSLIVMVTARGQKADKLRGLHFATDDYIAKPFDLGELLARARAVVRRSGPVVERLMLGRVTVDFRAQHARKGSRTLHLTHREYALLQFLAEREGRFASRNELLREVWGYPEVPATRSVDHAIARLRKKIEADAAHPRFIHTVYGDGYLLTPSGTLPSLHMRPKRRDALDA
jgi:DNA-binding response OmpR family regulator